MHLLPIRSLLTVYSCYSCAQVALTASADKTVCIWDANAGNKQHTIKVHTGEVRLLVRRARSCCCHDHAVMECSLVNCDSIPEWLTEGTCSIIIVAWSQVTHSHHTHDTQRVDVAHVQMTGISMHPTGDYFVATSQDKHWSFNAIETGQTLTMQTDAGLQSVRCASTHSVARFSF